VILFLPAFRKNRFVRFHAWQSVLLWGVFFVLSIVALLLSNVTAAMVFLLFGILASLAMSFLWIVLSVKAWKVSASKCRCSANWRRACRSIPPEEENGRGVFTLTLHPVTIKGYFKQICIFMGTQNFSFGAPCRKSWH